MSSPENEETTPFYVYLEPDDVLALYAELVPCTPHEAKDYLLSGNPRVLDGPLGRAQRYAEYEDADLAEQAAVLAHGFATGHYFADRNKRIAYVVLRSFLLVNGYDIPATEDERITWTLDLTQGSTHSHLATLIRTRLISIQDLS